MPGVGPEDVEVTWINDTTSTIFIIEDNVVQALLPGALRPHSTSNFDPLGTSIMRCHIRHMFTHDLVSALTPDIDTAGYLHTVEISVATNAFDGDGMEKQLDEVLTNGKFPSVDEVAPDLEFEQDQPAKAGRQ